MNLPACRYLFVYGTLRSEFGHPMHGLLLRSAKILGDATTQGGLFDIGSYPGLVIDSHPGLTVKGELYELDNGADILARLDDYEGCAPHFSQPHEYRRERRSVVSESGLEVQAWVYVYNWPVESAVCISSGDYLDVLAGPR